MCNTFIFSKCVYLFIGRACGILVLQPRVRAVPLVMEAQSPNHWTTTEVPLALSQFAFLFLHLIVNLKFHLSEISVDRMKYFINIHIFHQVVTLIFIIYYSSQ